MGPHDWSSYFLLVTLQSNVTMGPSTYLCIYATQEEVVERYLEDIGGEGVLTRLDVTELTPSVAEMLQDGYELTGLLIQGENPGGETQF